MKRICITAGSLVLGGIALWLGVHWYANREERLPALSQQQWAEARFKMTGERLTNAPSAIPLKAIPASQRVRLAIGGLGLPQAEQPERLRDLLTVELTGAKGLDLVERAALDKILRELQLSLSGLVRAKDAVRVGKLLHADWFLLGTTVSVTNRSKAIVARVVDTQTGIMRDIAVLELEPDLSAVAGRLGQFVRDCREAPAEPSQRIYLAVGSFADRSVNNRQRSFVNDLHAFLTAAYRGPKIFVLEREFADTLLHEVYLDLAGLTGDPGAARAVQMQSAFWLINGFYQSFETSKIELEVSMNASRVFGGTKQVLLRDTPGEPLLRKVKEALDKVLADSGPLVAPTRSSELTLQLHLGRELANLDSWDSAWHASRYENLTSGQEERRRRNLEEAIRAFQTVLLFDPNHREAKMYLGTLLRRYPLLRHEEGRDYYRRLLAEPVEDVWSERARDGLRDSLRWEPIPFRTRWYENASLQCANSNTIAFYKASTEAAAAQVVVTTEGDPKAQEEAEARLLRGIQGWSQAPGTNRPRAVLMGLLQRFNDSFGTNCATAGSSLVRLWPGLKAKYPELQPDVLAFIVIHQAESNSPVFAEFAQSLDEAAEHPEKLLWPREYFSYLSWDGLRWCAQAKSYFLTSKIIPALKKAYAKGLGGAQFEDELTMGLAYAYRGLERWQEALDIFQSYSNCPVYLGNLGIWGPAFTVALTSELANECRQKLGLAPVMDPREFKLGKSCLCLHQPPGYHLYFWAAEVPPALMAADADGVWIATHDELVSLDFELRTNWVVPLPFQQEFQRVTCLLLTPTNIWLASDGAGLLQFDRLSKKFRLFTEADGLLANQIVTLSLCGDELWLGYGRGQGTGGLGSLDLHTFRPVSYSRSLNLQATSGPDVRESPSQPTRMSIGVLAALPSGDVWFGTPLSTPYLRRYRVRENLWDQHQEILDCDCLVADGATLIAARHDPKHPILGISVRDLSTGRWRTPPAAPNLPHGTVSTITLAGNETWLGGKGFIARYDTARDSLRAYSYIRAPAVNRLQVAGGYLWAQFDQHLYRFPLAKIP